LVVVDRNGTVLARMPNVGDEIGKSLAEPHVLAMLSGQRNGGVFEARDTHGVDRLWAQAPLIPGQGLHAAVGVPKSVAFEDIDRRLFRNLAALGAVALMALGAAW
jgi:hypothetical protein